MLNVWSSTHLTRPILRTLNMFMKNKNIYQFPSNLIHFSSLGRMPGVAQLTQVKTIRPLDKIILCENCTCTLYTEFYLGIHVTPVGWSGLTIYAVIAKTDNKLYNKYKWLNEKLYLVYGPVCLNRGGKEWTGGPRTVVIPVAPASFCCWRTWIWCQYNSKCCRLWKSTQAENGAAQFCLTGRSNYQLIILQKQSPRATENLRQFLLNVFVNIEICATFC